MVPLKTKHISLVKLKMDRVHSDRLHSGFLEDTVSLACLIHLDTEQPESIRPNLLNFHSSADIFYQKHNRLFF